MAAYRQDYDSRHLQADCQNLDQLQNPTLGNQVWATFTFTARGDSEKSFGLNRGDHRTAKDFMQQSSLSCHKYSKQGYSENNQDKLLPNRLLVNLTPKQTTIKSLIQQNNQQLRA